MKNGKGSLERQINWAIVAIYKEYLGRGPTDVRTALTNLTCVTLIEDSMTKAERSLVDRGEVDTVREIRRKFQHTMHEDICAAIEGLTGRKKRSFLSDHDPVRDVAIEVLVFADEPDGVPSESLEGEA